MDVDHDIMILNLVSPPQYNKITVFLDRDHCTIKYSYRLKGFHIVYVNLSLIIIVSIIRTVI